MEEGKGRVCVTGGTGFIGSWTVKKLLEDGYSVNTTIRDQTRDVSYLTSLPGASKKLQIFTADLNNPESFKPAIEGCIGVFLIASFSLEILSEDEETVVERTVGGALNILEACRSTKSVRRVVYTSTAAAVIYNGKEEEVLDESSWSDLDYLRSSKPFAWPIVISKVLTEKALLEFGEENGLEVVSVTPSCVVGPCLCPKLPRSVRIGLDMAFGNKLKSIIAELNHDFVNMPMVHVDDVARAHIFLLQHPNPKGRYNCSPHFLTAEKMSQFLSTKHPEFGIPTKDSSKYVKCIKLPALSSKKIMDAGFEFEHGLEETLEDGIQFCTEKGYL